MPFTTLSSGLTIQVPTSGTRNWAATFLAQCFQKISEHDHTGSGKGLQIGTSALATNAVTTVKITDLNVTAAKLAADAVTTAKILDGNVTLAKLANLATDRLIGRDTAGTGVPEAITVGGGLEFTGSGGIQRSALTGNVTASAGSNSTTIANGVVTEAMLADDAATRSAELVNGWTAAFDPGGSVAGVIFVVGRNDATRAPMPKAGKITHLSISSYASIATGSITITLFKNGSTTSQTLSLSSGYTNHGSITPVSFAAGDYLEIRASSTSVTATVDVMGGAWGHFTE